MCSEWAYLGAKHSRALEQLKYQVELHLKLSIKRLTADYTAILEFTHHLLFNFLKICDEGLAEPLS